ncbi:MAG: Fe-S metabolism protein SufE [Flammeovirgaceae bacterium]|nr:Fe-S metabolism protein SufE [Flammeovirgaceae bacterium]MBE98218.1 Fe-S metabolism protein SufE [Flammeovirgaceae bacterium]|tara:strand:+ start:18699 stop:19112 length:414 start_codon:yes stop_codon:yes gene_type:complete
MSTTQTQNDIVEDFKVLEEDFEMTLNYLMEIGEKMDDYDEELKSDDNLVKGCQSKVWLSHELKGGKIFFSGDSNTSITKGLLSLLIKIFSGQTPENILNTKLYFINKTGLCRFIGTQRSNGLEAMENKFKIIALSNK